MATRVCPECGRETSRRRCPDCDTRTQREEAVEFFDRRAGGATLWTIHGESFRQDALRAFKRTHGRTGKVIVECEPDNPADKNAVKVLSVDRQWHMGYLRRTDAKRYSRFVAANPRLELDAVIVGGERDRPALGIYVDGTPYRAHYEADPKVAKRLDRARARRPEAVVPAVVTLDVPASVQPRWQALGAILRGVAVGALALVTIGVLYLLAVMFIVG